MRNERKRKMIWKPANANKRETKQTWDWQYRDWETSRMAWDNIRELDWETGSLGRQAVSRDTQFRETGSFWETGSLGRLVVKGDCQFRETGSLERQAV